MRHFFRDSSRNSSIDFFRDFFDDSFDLVVSYRDFFWDSFKDSPRIPSWNSLGNASGIDPGTL